MKTEDWVEVLMELGFSENDADKASLEIIRTLED